MDHEEQQRRFRSPSFIQTEIVALVELIDKYKSCVLNKSVTAAASKAKEIGWEMIANEFNKLGFDHERPAEVLRGKWKNMTTGIRRHTDDVMNIKYDGLNEKIALLLAQAEVLHCDNPPPPGDPDDEDNNHNESGEQILRTEESKLDARSVENLHEDDAENMSTDNSESDDNNERVKRKRQRLSNFSPQDCRILIQCIRKYKHHIICKENTAYANKLKNKAWQKVTQEYNKLSPQKRSASRLKEKFRQLKRNAKRSSSFSFKLHEGKHEKLLENSFSNIKQEPATGYEIDMGLDVDDVIAPEVNDRPNPPILIAHMDGEGEDPLCSVLNGDSGIGSTSSGTITTKEITDVIKLEMELLKYKLDTAKLERERLEKAMQQDALEQESKTIERALRLRKVRLECAAAETALPADHPARRFLPSETVAQQYMSQFDGR